MRSDSPDNQSSSSESADLQAGHRYACALTRDAILAERLVAEAWVKLSRTATGQRERTGTAGRRLALFKAIRQRYSQRHRWPRGGRIEKTLFAQCADLESVELETLYLVTVENLSPGEVSVFLDSSVNQILQLLASGRAKLDRCFAGDSWATCN